MTKTVLMALWGLAFAAVVLAAMPGAGLAQDQRVLVTVNDRPITSFDVTMRINLWKLVGRRVAGDGIRKKALNSLIDDLAAIEEAKKFRMDPSEKEVDDRVLSVAKGMKTDEAGLKSKLKAQGISVSALRLYIAGQIAFNRLVRGKNKESTEPSKEEVDKRLQAFRAEIDGKVAKFMADPRMRPVTVYKLLEVNFPVEAGDPTLLQSRAIEVNQFVKRLKSCGSARAAASGIFNVQIGRTIEADGSKLPPQMKKLLDRTKVGTAIGPMRGPKGLQAMAFCGTRKIVPPKPKVTYPTREQVEQIVANEKYAAVEAKYAGAFRKGLMIEYRDPSYAE